MYLRPLFFISESQAIKEKRSKGSDNIAVKNSTLFPILNKVCSEFLKNEWKQISSHFLLRD